MMDMNRQGEFSLDGHTLTGKETKRDRKKRGMCLTCGDVRTHAVSTNGIFGSSMKPLTNNYVLNGKCIACMKSAKAAKDKHHQQQKEKRGGSRNSAAILDDSSISDPMNMGQCGAMMNHHHSNNVHRNSTAADAAPSRNNYHHSRSSNTYDDDDEEQQQGQQQQRNMVRILRRSSNGCGGVEAEFVEYNAPVSPGGSNNNNNNNSASASAMDRQRAYMMNSGRSDVTTSSFGSFVSDNDHPPQAQPQAQTQPQQHHRLEYSSRGRSYPGSVQQMRPITSGPRNNNRSGQQRPQSSSSSMMGGSGGDDIYQRQNVSGSSTQTTLSTTSTTTASNSNSATSFNQHDDIETQLRQKHEVLQQFISITGMEESSTPGGRQEALMHLEQTNYNLELAISSYFDSRTSSTSTTNNSSNNSSNNSNNHNRLSIQQQNNDEPQKVYLLDLQEEAMSGVAAGVMHKILSVLEIYADKGTDCSSGSTTFNLTSDVCQVLLVAAEHQACFTESMAAEGGNNGNGNNAYSSDINSNNATSLHRRNSNRSELFRADVKTLLKGTAGKLFWIGTNNSSHTAQHEELQTASSKALWRLSTVQPYQDILINAMPTCVEDLLSTIEQMSQPAHKDMLIPACAILANVIRCSNDINKRAFLRHQGLEIIIDTMVRHFKASELQVHCLSMFQSLSAVDNNYKLAIANAGGILPIVTAMKMNASHETVQSLACWVLSNLATHAEVKREVGIQSGAVPKIIDAMLKYPDSVEVQQWACRALWSLSVAQEIKTIIVDELGIEALLRAMEIHRNVSIVQERACATMSNLASKNPVNCSKLVRAGCVDSIKVAMETHPFSANVQEKASLALHKIIEHGSSQNKDVVAAMRRADLYQVLESASLTYPDVCAERCQYMIERIYTL